MKLKLPPPSKGALTVHVRRINNDNANTKEQNQINAEGATVTRPVAPRDVSAGGASTRWGTAKWAIRLAFSRKYQSVHVEGGIELPILIDVDDVAGSARRGLDLAEDILAHKMVDGMDDAEKTLDAVIAKVGR